MKHFIVAKWRIISMLIVLFVTINTNTKAQTVVATVGTGTSAAAYGPIYTSYDYSYIQILYNASVITAAGGSSTKVINKVAFFLNAKGASDIGNDTWTISMANVARTTFSSTTNWEPVANLTEVYSGKVTFPAAGNWMEIPLTTEFQWDGTSSIIVAIQENTPSKTTGCTWRYTSTSNTFLYSYANTTPINPSAPPVNARSVYRSNIQFSFIDKCTGTPTAGSATYGDYCIGKPVIFNVTGASATGGLTYQWQKAVLDINLLYSNISGATSKEFIDNTPSNGYYYRCKVTCSHSSKTSNSSSIKLNYTNQIASSSGATRCGTGAVNLTATSNNGEPVKWYTSSSGGTSIGSGSPFTTPTLSTTTDFYASPETDNFVSATLTGTSTVNASTTAQTPFTGLYTSVHTQYLILESMLTSIGLKAGYIKSINFEVTSKSSSKTYSDYTIQMANVADVALSSGMISPTLTPVYKADYNSVLGNNTFDLDDNGFYWDGTSSLLIDICFDNVTYGLGYSSNDAVAFVATSHVGTYGRYNDVTNLCGVTTTGSASSVARVPKITFSMNEPCTGPRVLVKATVNPLPKPTISPTAPINICFGESKVLTGGGGTGNYSWSKSGSIISGANSSTYTASATGKYRFIITNPTTGCFDSSVAVDFTENPIPDIILSPAVIPAVCADSFVHFTSSSSVSDLTYQWYFNDTAIDDAKDKGLDFSKEGKYKLIAKSKYCEDTSDIIDFKMNPLPVSEASISSINSAICMGGNIELNANDIPPTSSYQWYRNDSILTGVISQKFITNIPGYYTVKVKDVNKCQKLSDSVHVFNSPMGYPDITPKESKFCEGKKIKILANTGPYGAIFKWYKNGVLQPTDTFKSIDVGDAGVYEVTVTDIFGCTFPSPKSTVFIEPLPIVPIIIKTGSVLSTDMPYASYQWYRNGKIQAGATSRNFKYDFDGSYHVVVGNAANCFVNSDTILIDSKTRTNIGAIKPTDADITLYPNPTQAIVYIKSNVQISILVHDIQGRLIFKDENIQHIDMTNFADGAYIFTIIDLKGNILKKDRVVKNISM